MLNKFAPLGGSALSQGAPPVTTMTPIMTKEEENKYWAKVYARAWLVRGSVRGCMRTWLPSVLHWMRLLSKAYL